MLAGRWLWSAALRPDGALDLALLPSESNSRPARASEEKLEATEGGPIVAALDAAKGNVSTASATLHDKLNTYSLGLTEP